MLQREMTVRGYIIEAFIILLKTKDFEDISVSDIITKAGVARASFYRHFSSTNNLLNTIVADIANDLNRVVYSYIDRAEKPDWYKCANELFTIAENNHNYLCTISSHNMSLLFEELNNRLDKNPSNKTGAEKYLRVAKTSILMGIVRSWLSTPNREPKEALVNYTADLLNKF